jgi:hypothetical protein
MFAEIMSLIWLLVSTVPGLITGLDFSCIHKT